MGLSSAMRVSSSGMVAERYRMDVISSNIANVNSVRTKDQEAYRRQIVILEPTQEGVRIAGQQSDMSELRAEYEPGNPNRDSEDKVYYSNVNSITEMVDMIGASRSYEANMSAFNATRSMIRAAFNIGRI